MTVAVTRTHRSPNFNRRLPGAVVTAIILHADGDASVASAIAYLCTPGAAQPPVSYHCIVGRLGDVYELVDPQLRAWHAGVSALESAADCNTYSVGVCMSNKNDGVEPFPDVQQQAAAEYCALLMREFPAITLERIVRHLDVALPKGRKNDPHPTTFDLARFRDRVAAARSALTPAVA